MYTEGLLSERFINIYSDFWDNVLTDSERDTKQSSNMNVSILWRRSIIRYQFSYESVFDIQFLDTPSWEEKKKNLILLFFYCRTVFVKKYFLADASIFDI